MGNKHVPFESLAELRAATWRSVLDVISQEGLVFRRRPHPIWFYVFVSLAILFAFAAPLAGRGWESIPVDVIGLGALVIAGVAAVARAIDVAWDATIVVDDNGVEIWRGGSKRVSAAWGEAAAVGLLNMLQRDALDLPGEFKGRDFVVALMNWCRENRTEIAAAGGSLNRTVEAMAHGSGLHFNFDWWDKALSSTLLIGLFLGVLLLIGVAASQESLASLGALEILASIALTVVFGGLALVSALDWKDAGLKITISTLFTAFVFILTNKTITPKILTLLSRIKFLHKYLEQINTAYTSFHQILGVKSFAVTLLMSFLSWMLECLSVYFVFYALGINVEFIWTIFDYAFSILFGSLTALPAGLGVTDGSLIFLISDLGYKQSTAVAAAIFIRLATLWFAVLVGTITMMIFRKRFNFNEQNFN